MIFARLFKRKKLLIFNYSLLIILGSCSVSSHISRKATVLIKDSSLLNAHIGISIYDPAAGKYLYNYQSEKYFIPASNTKLFTCYAGMKYLGDSLVGMRYQDLDTALLIFPAGDPTFLHSGFKIHPVLNFLKTEKKTIYISAKEWKENALGFGWAWDDYNSEDMAERSPLPIYGNVVTINLRPAADRLREGSDYRESDRIAKIKKQVRNFEVTPSFFDSTINHEISNYTGSRRDTHFYLDTNINVSRNRASNNFYSGLSKAHFSKTIIPFLTLKNNSGHFEDTDFTFADILSSILDQKIIVNTNSDLSYLKNCKIIHSQPTDSLFKPMMHRSDNFFAEQTLLMVSNERLGYMNDAAIIDTLLKTDLQGLPQHPKWVDGSGLSRYNLFTPQDFIFILNKMQHEFGLERLKNILPTGGTGTISSYYQNMAGSIFAKTGTLSNNCALSGYLVTKKGKLLLFSVLANNYRGAAPPVRRAVERFINYIRDTN